MTSYSLREPFTLEDARALLGKRAEITVETDPDEGTTGTYSSALVSRVYHRPGASRGYLILGDLPVGYEDGDELPGAAAIVPTGDVRKVENIRGQA